MASKKASDSSPVSLASASASAGEVRGPVAMMVWLPVGRRQARDFLALQGHQRMGEQRFLHGGGEAVPVDRERAAGRQLVGVGRAHDQRAGAAHLLVDHADGVVLRIVGAEGIGADQLGQLVGQMGLGAAHRAHLVQHHGHARVRELPRRLAAREPAAHDMHVDA